MLCPLRTAQESNNYVQGEQVAGPIALMDCVEAYAQFSEKGVSVLPAGTVYAYNWREVRTSCPRP